MTLRSLGRLISQRRKAQGLTLAQLAVSAGVGRSTLAALESAKLPELGFVKVTRICETLGLVLEARTLRLEAPLMPHRHLTKAAGRDLTKAAIADVIERGDIQAWRGLAQALRDDRDGQLTQRTREVVAALDVQDAKVRTFASLLPDLLRGRDAAA